MVICFNGAEPLMGSKTDGPLFDLNSLNRRKHFIPCSLLVILNRSGGNLPVYIRRDCFAVLPSSRLRAANHPPHQLRGTYEDLSWTDSD